MTKCTVKNPKLISAGMFVAVALNKEEGIADVNKWTFIVNGCRELTVKTSSSPSSPSFWSAVEEVVEPAEGKTGIIFNFQNHL